jgi:pimeloyl-ACP methyl ester carboxylesterase
MKTQQQLAKIVDTKLDVKQLVVESYNLNYVVAGNGEPLLLLHGANIGWAQWYQNLGELSRHFKVFAIELPGAGDSTKVNFRKTDLETDYVKIVDKFITANKISKLNIIGSSFGGWIALRLAIERKPYIDKIVLTNPIAFTKTSPIKFRPVSIYPLALVASKTALRPKRSNKNLEKFMRDVFYDKQQHLAPEFIDYFYELSKTSHNLLFISRLSRLRGMRKELFLGNQLSKINRPVLLIWGKEDPLMPYSTVKNNFKLIPNIKVVTLDKVGHMPPVEAADSFNKLAINFLRDNH